jgi:hypothetical protein
VSNEQIEKIEVGESCEASVTRRAGITEGVKIGGHFEVECVGADGKVKWRDTIENLVTTVGKNDILDKFLDLAAASAKHLGLKGVGTAVVGDTMASHGSWLEVGGANAPTYTGNRQVPAFNAAGSGSKTTSAALSFAMTSTGTVAGCFIVMSGLATKDNTTGVLYSAGDFTQGNKPVTNGDTLNVSYTATA